MTAIFSTYNFIVTKRSHRFLFSVLSGVLFSLPWLSGISWCAFVAFVPLLFLNDFFVRKKADYLSISFWGHAFIAVFIWNILSVWWIAIPMLTGSVLVIVANSLLMSFVLLLAHLLSRRWGLSVGHIALAVFWLSFEYLHYHWDVDFPWLNLGNAFANHVKCVQWYEFTGALGGSTWCLLINIGVFYSLLFFRERKNIKKIATAFFATTASIVLPIIISINIFLNYNEQKAPVKVVIAQTNINPYSEKFGLEDEIKKQNLFLDLVSHKKSDSVDLIIGPETLFENSTYWDEAKWNENLFLARFDSFLCCYPSAGMLIGTTTIRKYKSQNKPTLTARFCDDEYYDQFNTALFIEKSDRPQAYHKSRLVGGVEKMPFQKYLFFLSDLTFDLGGSTGSLGTQPESENFTTHQGLVLAPVVCYESVFGDYVSSFVKKGAQILCIITNDGWWKNTVAYKHLLWYACLRAVENRRSIARCANGGISCFINQRGEIEKRLAHGKKAALSGVINKNSELTFYSKHGDYIGVFSLYVSVALLILYILGWYAYRHKTTSS